MIGARPKRFVRAGAFSVALVLLFGWFAAPVTLAVESAETCSMACCVEQGRCCCVPRHPSVQGKVSGSRKNILSAELLTRCPEGCSTTQSAARAFSRETERAAVASLNLINTVQQRLRQPVCKQEYLQKKPSIPRA